jgi:hypothetical protein
MKVTKLKQTRSETSNVLLFVPVIELVRYKGKLVILYSLSNNVHAIMRLEFVSMLVSPASAKASWIMSLIKEVAFGKSSSTDGIAWYLEWSIGFHQLPRLIRTQ